MREPEAEEQISEFIRHGRIVNVYRDVAGSSLLEDAGASDARLQVVSIADFDEGGGQVELRDDDNDNVEVVAYGGVDFDTDELTGVDARAADYSDGSRVRVYPLQKSVLANVKMDGVRGHVVARVPIYLQPFLPRGSRDVSSYEAEWCLVSHDGSEWYIHDILGAAPALQPEHATAERIFHYHAEELCDEFDVLSNDPILYWRFDEPSGSTAADSSGNGHDGTIGAAVVLNVAGVRNTAFQFSQDGGFNSKVFDADNHFGGASIHTATFELWLKQTSTSGNQRLWERGTGIIGETACVVTSTIIRFQMIQDDNTVRTLDWSHGGAPSDGDFHKLQCDTDGTDMHIYWDDALVATLGITDDLQWDGLGNLTVGWKGGGADTGDEFAGTIDEFVIYPVAVADLTSGGPCGVALSGQRATLHQAYAVLENAPPSDSSYDIEIDGTPVATVTVPAGGNTSPLETIETAIVGSDVVRVCINDLGGAEFPLDVYISATVETGV